MLKMGRGGGVVDVEAVVAIGRCLAGILFLLSDFHHELDGSMEAAIEMTVVAGQVVEEFRVFEHGCAQQLQVAFVALSHAAGLEVSLIDAGTFDGGGDDGRFDAGEALDSPGGVGDLMDECLFDAVSWVVGVLVEGDVTVELGGVLAGDDGVFGEQAVFECIFGDAGLAFFSARSGRFGCVFSVGPNLGFC